MTWKTEFTDSVQRLLRLLYEIPGVRWTANATGLNNILIHVHKNLDNYEPRIDKIVDFTAGGTSIKFRIHKLNSLRPYLEDEREVIELLLNEITSGDTFYDVGAFYGPYSALVAKTDLDVTVHAFEPSGDRQERFRDTVQLNGINPTLHGVALSTDDFEMRLTDNGELTEDGGSETVRVVNADRYIRDEGLEPPTVVKIDVEGNELDVIQGMGESLSTHCRLLLCEVHQDSRGVDPVEVSDVLEDLGFNTERLASDRDGDDFIQAWK